MGCNLANLISRWLRPPGRAHYGCPGSQPSLAPAHLLPQRPGPIANSKLAARATIAYPKWKSRVDRDDRACTNHEPIVGRDTVHPQVCGGSLSSSPIASAGEMKSPFAICAPAGRHCGRGGRCGTGLVGLQSLSAAARDVPVSAAMTRRDANSNERDPP